MHRSTFVFLSGIFLFSAAIAAGQITPSADSASQQPADCSTRSVLFNFEDTRGERTQEVPVWQMPGGSAFFFDAGMNIDADGAPNAYNPDNTGLDDLSNAGEPGHWGGIIADELGNPYIQTADDPFPGFYVSCTSLSDRNKARIDPTRYVDASKIPYVVLPGLVARQGGAELGDLAVVFNLRNGKSSYAIFADIGTMGEGSVALARNLGIREDARNGGARNGIRYLVFPESGNGQPRPIEEINAEAEKVLQAWGGAGRLSSCPAPAFPPPPAPRPADFTQTAQ